MQKLNKIQKLNQISILSRLIIGLKKGYSTPTLPDNLIKLNSTFIIRTLRFLGGTSFLLLLSNSYINNPIYILYIALFFAFIFTCYQYYLSFNRIKHIIKVLKSEELDIKK